MNEEFKTIIAISLCTTIVIFGMWAFGYPAVDWWQEWYKQSIGLR